MTCRICVEHAVYRGEFMYCPDCGSELESDSAFCHACGARVTDESQGSGGAFGKTPGRGMKIAALTSLSLVAIAFAVFGTDLWYVHRETGVALKAAQGNQFNTAVSAQQQAVRFSLRKQPLSSQLATYQFAVQERNQVQAANTEYNKKEWSKSAADYQSVVTALKDRPQTWLNSLRQAAKTGAEQSTLRGLEVKAKQTQDISTIVSIYQQLSTYTDKLGQDARTTVQRYLDSATAKTIQKDLLAHQFDAANHVVASAMEGPANDENLTQLQQSITAEKQAYEQKQQKIMEEALAQEAAIANANQKPLQILKVSTSSNAAGDFVVTGKVKNTGTNLIGSISLEILFYNQLDQNVDTETVDVNPDPLPSGQTGTFSVAISAFYGASSAKVSNYTWLNE